MYETYKKAVGEKMSPVEFIADLYEIKSHLIRPWNYKNEYVEPNITHTVVATLIATFSDKYKVTSNDVQKTLNERHLRTQRELIAKE